MYYRVSVTPSTGVAPDGELFAVVIDAPDEMPEQAVINAGLMVREFSDYVGWRSDTSEERDK